MDLYFTTRKTKPIQTPFEVLFERTSSAYMFGHYTRYEWEAILYHLQARGLTPDEVVSFVLSKHIRWADDSKPLNRKGRASDVIHYLIRHFNTNESLKAECKLLETNND